MEFQYLENNNPNSVNFVQSIRDFLQNNSERICIPQRERRAFFMKNTMGSHAIDVFQDLIEDVDLTRVYSRAVDLNAEKCATCYDT